MKKFLKYILISLIVSIFNVALYGYKDSLLNEFNLKNIEFLIQKNLLENELIKPVYLS